MKNFIDILKEDTGLNNEQEIAACMEDREVWKKIVSRLPDKEIDGQVKFRSFEL